jgi:hypothetical protein
MHDRTLRRVGDPRVRAEVPVQVLHLGLLPLLRCREAAAALPALVRLVVATQLRDEVRT